jgi:hypothetical protein
MPISPDQKEVQAALWHGWIKLAKELPNHHILAVELLRTHNDETIAVFTAVKDRMPVRYVVRGDSSGRVKPGIAEHCDPKDPHAPVAMEARLGTEDGGVTPEGMALGEPPPRQPPMPGIIAVGAALLTVAFGVGEQVPS